MFTVNSKDNTNKDVRALKTYTKTIFQTHMSTKAVRHCPKHVQTTFHGKTRHAKTIALFRFSLALLLVSPVRLLVTPGNNTNKT